MRHFQHNQLDRDVEVYDEANPQDVSWQLAFPQPYTPLPAPVQLELPFEFPPIAPAS
jgi:hypothetical protein